MQSPLIKHLKKIMSEVPDCGDCAVSPGSGQLTTGARHYGITTDGAAWHIAAMLESDPVRPLWEDLTGFDRACIAELLAYFRQNK